MQSSIEKSYQELSQELELVLSEMQLDDVDVDRSAALYEKGMELIKKLEDRLKTAENKIEKIKIKFS